jgi:hypothetical protein
LIVHAKHFSLSRIFCDRPFGLHRLDGHQDFIFDPEETTPATEPTINPAA